MTTDRGSRKNVRLVVSSWVCEVSSIPYHTWHASGSPTFRCNRLQLTFPVSVRFLCKRSVRALFLSLSPVDRHTTKLVGFQPC